MTSPTNVTLTLTNNAVLTWKWATNFWLGTTIVGEGTVNIADGWHPKGSVIHVTATPLPHARFVGWSGQTQSATISGATITCPMNNARLITATFIHRITVSGVASPTAGGSVTGGGVFDAGNNKVTLVASAHSGWLFKHWSDGATTATHAPMYNLTNDTTLVATFVPRVTVLTKASPSTGGSVTGGGSFYVGTTITLVAKPNTGWTFVQWEDGNTMATLHMVVTGAVTKTATFVHQHESDAIAKPIAPPVVVAPAPQPITSTPPATTPPGLTVQLLDLTSLARIPNGSIIATVSFSAGTLHANLMSAAGPSTATLLIESAGPDANGNGVPDVIETAMGTQLVEGATLLTIQYVNGQLMATTPFVSMLEINGPSILPVGTPASWQLVPIPQ